MAWTPFFLVTLSPRIQVSSRRALVRRYALSSGSLQPGDPVRAPPATRSPM